MYSYQHYHIKGIFINKYVMKSVNLLYSYTLYYFVSAIFETTL